MLTADRCADLPDLPYRPTDKNTLPHVYVPTSCRPLVSIVNMLTILPRRSLIFTIQTNTECSSASPGLSERPFTQYDRRFERIVVTLPTRVRFLVSTHLYLCTQLYCFSIPRTLHCDTLPGRLLFPESFIPTVRTVLIKVSFTFTHVDSNRATFLHPQRDFTSPTGKNIL